MTAPPDMTKDEERGLQLLSLALDLLGIADPHKAALAGYVLHLGRSLRGVV